MGCWLRFAAGSQRERKLSRLVAGDVVEFVVDEVVVNSVRERHAGDGLLQANDLEAAGRVVEATGQQGEAAVGADAVLVVVAALSESGGNDGAGDESYCDCGGADFLEHGLDLLYSISLDL